MSFNQNFEKKAWLAPLMTAARAALPSIAKSVGTDLAVSKGLSMAGKAASSLMSKGQKPVQQIAKSAPAVAGGLMG